MQSYAPKMLKNAFLCFILKKINLVQAVFSRQQGSAQEKL